jgi:pyruvate dehydrogenase E2 component (dihydrolipoamide acetyltransferase)
MATPSVRKLARELGVNVRAMAGSGPGGRITEHDVKQMAHELIMTGSGSATGALSPYLGEAPSFDAYGPVRYEKMNAIRRETAKHMAASWSAIPHVTNFDKADFSQVTAAREALAAVNGRKVGLTAILLKVLARALRVHPRFNACIDMDRQQIMYREYVNIGVAADTPRGLLVPVIRNVDTKDVKIIHEELADKAERARAGKLPPEEMQGGGFTLSNLGGLGGGWFTPIIHAPEVAILGVGTARTEALYEDGEWKPRSLCPLSLSYDHRLIDGADAARFLRWFVGALENPLIALLEGD